MKHLDEALKQALMSALDERRHDDFALMFANLLRRRKDVISPHARAALPVDSTICQPLMTNRLTKHEIEAFGIRDTGWHMIAVEDCRLVDAKRFPYTTKDTAYRDHIETYIRSFDGSMDEEPFLYGAFHESGSLRDFQTAHEFRPECRQL
ncbi:MAG: hypothetical protein P1U83_11410 [Roseovarius sp.]|nr:hypothetical protein [Roseovarius sp.]